MKKIFLAFCLLGVLGCADEEGKIPADLLPQKNLTSILVDIHIAESRVEAMRVSPDTAQVLYNKLQAEVFKKHKVTEAEFTKTYNFYLENIKALDKVYEGLVDSLGMREINMTGQPREKTKAPPLSDNPEDLP